MTLLQGFFLLIGLFLILMAVCWGIIVLERKFPGKEYDERQQAARGRAYRAGFWFGMIYYLTVSVVAINREGEMSGFILSFGIAMTILIFHLYCMFTGAALPLSEKPWSFIVFYTIMSIRYLFRAFSRTGVDTLTMSREGQRAWMNLTMGVFFLALAALHLMNQLRKDRE